MHVVTFSVVPTPDVLLTTITALASVLKGLQEIRLTPGKGALRKSHVKSKKTVHQSMYAVSTSVESGPVSIPVKSCLVENLKSAQSRKTNQTVTVPQLMLEIL